MMMTMTSQAKAALMVVCEGGLVVELGLPDPDKMDTAHTFKIPEVPMRTYQFKSIKSHLRVCTHYCFLILIFIICIVNLILNY